MNETTNIEATSETNEPAAIEAKNRVAPSPQNVPEVDTVDGYVTTDKAAALLGKAIDEDVKTSRINYLAYSKQIDAIRIGSTILIKRSSLEAKFDDIKGERGKASRKAELKKQLSDLKGNEDIKIGEYKRRLKEINDELASLR